MAIDSLPDDVETLKAMLLAALTESAAARAESAVAQAKARNAEAEAHALALLIEKMKYTIAKLKHEQYGQSSERGALLEQLELKLADLEENASQAEAAAQLAAAAASEMKITVQAFERRKPARRPLPDHLPRERVVEPAPSACGCCGGTSLRKIGEDVTETLEVIPRQWKVIQHVREKFSCRACEKITQPPAPSHPIARGRAGPHLLAQVLFGKYGLHLPLNRQSAAFAREGIELDVSTLADWSRSFKRMSLRPSAFMPTTRRFRFWPRVRRAPDDYGPMCAMIAPSPGPMRRRRCSSTRAIARACIPKSISHPMPA
jgi:transposase